MTNGRDNRLGINQGKLAIALGLLAIALSIYLWAAPDNFITRAIPWLKFGDPSLNIIPIIGGIFVIFLGCLALYDSKPIPDDYVPPPEVPHLEQDETWRKATGFRYLEKFKDVCTHKEQMLRSLYHEAEAAHRKLPNASGFLEYKSLRRTLKKYKDDQANYEESIVRLKEHIEKLFAGDVRSDILEIEESIQKNRREQEEYQAEIRELDEKIRTTTDKDLITYYEQQKQDLRARIKRLDMNHIEAQSAIKELREFDFQRLYRELGVRPETMRHDPEHLDEIKRKADIVSQIKPQRGGPHQTEDETRLNAATQGIKYDIKFDVRQRLGKNLTTLDEIQRFYRERSEAIKGDHSLSYDERTEQLDQLRRDCDEYKNELKIRETSIYEAE